MLAASNASYPEKANTKEKNTMHKVKKIRKYILKVCQIVIGKAFSWASVQRHIAGPAKIYAVSLDVLRIPAVITIPLLLVTCKVKVGCRRLVSYSWTMIQALCWRSMQISKPVCLLCAPQHTHS